MKDVDVTVRVEYQKTLRAWNLLRGRYDWKNLRNECPSNFTAVTEKKKGKEISERGND